MIGTQLGHYRIASRLGSGGMGVVWLADDLELGRQVALKTLHGEIEAGAGQLARFRREARAVAALSHPNIVTLYSVEEALGLRFLVMEYVDGVRLDDRTPLNGLPPAETVRIGAEIADALATAHDKGIVHRDLKPGNVLIARDGRVKVVDFGIARAFEIEDTPSGPRVGDTSMTLDGHAVGTLHYMSPEQLGGHPVDHRTDLYSLGVVLHEMTTGRKPFSGNSVVSVTESINCEIPRALDPGATGLPSEICTLVARLLAKRPSDRPDSTALVRDQLLDGYRALGGDAARAVRLAPPGPAAPARGNPSVPARPSARRLIAGLTLIATALATALLWTRNRASEANIVGALGAAAASPARPVVRGEPPSIAVLPLANYTGDPDYFVDGMTDGVIGALARIDGLRVISRQSTMHYKGSGKRLPEIASELSVDYVVEGSLRRNGGRIRVEAKLFRPDPEKQVWSETFDRETKDVLALHADLAQSLAHAVGTGFDPSVDSSDSVRRSVDPAAYEAFLRGLHLTEQARPDSLRRAKGYFEEALLIDAAFPQAHVGLARVHGLLAYLYEDIESNASRQRAESLRAIELDPALAEAHVSLGDHQRYFQWDWKGSEASYRRALASNPNSAAAHRGLWALTASQGRLDEAGEYLAVARRLDPFSAAVESIHGYHLLFLRDESAADRAFRRALEIDPAFPPAHGGRWTLCSLIGETPECRGHLASILRSIGQADIGQSIEELPGSDSMREVARVAGLALEERSRTSRVPIGIGAALLVVAHDLDRAESWILRAHAERDPELIWLGMDPSWAPLRERPAIQSILRKMQLAG